MLLFILCKNNWNKVKISPQVKDKVTLELISINSIKWIPVWTNQWPLKKDKIVSQSSNYLSNTWINTLSLTKIKKVKRALELISVVKLKMSKWMIRCFQTLKNKQLIAPCFLKRNMAYHNLATSRKKEWINLCFLKKSTGYQNLEILIQNKWTTQCFLSTKRLKNMAFLNLVNWASKI